MSSNTIKIIAGVSMFLDHLGFILFPSELWLRIVGRLAFPIFAFCIAEGATYTKNYLKYICLVGITALVCDIAVFVVQGRYMSCAVTTFFFSLVLIYLYKKVESAYKKYYGIYPLFNCFNGANRYNIYRKQIRIYRIRYSRGFDGANNLCVKKQIFKGNCGSGFIFIAVFKVGADILSAKCSVGKRIFLHNNISV